MASRVKHTVGYRRPEVLDLEDAGPGIRFSEDHRIFFNEIIYKKVITSISAESFKLDTTPYCW